MISLIEIKGVNRHEDYAEFGCAIPLETMYRDIEGVAHLFVPRLFLFDYIKGCNPII